VLAAVDAAAAALGLRPGMAVGHACALIPDLTVVEADAAGDAAALARLAAWCLRRYAPLAAPDPPGGIWIDATGCAHLFGGEAAMLADLVGRLTAQGFAARAAIADTPGAAHAVARFAPGDERVRVVPAGGNADALADLPVEALRLPPAAVDGLRRLGFERIGPLAAAPRAPVALRFGNEVGRRLDQAMGRAAEPISPVLPSGVPRRRLGFAEPVSTPEDLRRAIGRLAADLCRDLEAGGLGARRLDLLFLRVDGRPAAVRIGTARPTRDAGRLAALLADRLDTLDPGLGVEAMILSAPLAEPLSPAQLGAGGLAGAGDAADLSPLVDRLLNRLGPSRLYRVAPVESDVPERSVRTVPPLAPPVGATWPPALPRPARLLAPPEPVEVVAMLPDHPPVLFVWRRGRHRVRHADGPERIFGEWWRSESEVAALRDYYRVEDEAGGRFWLFRDGAPEAGARWWMHGLFG